MTGVVLGTSVSGMFQVHRDRLDARRYDGLGHPESWHQKFFRDLFERLGWGWYISANVKTIKDRITPHMNLHESYIAKANKSFGAFRMSIVYDLALSESCMRFIR